MDKMAAPEDAAAPFVGAWSLVSWVQTSPDGETEYPMGEDAVGRILYSGDGHMAAHLMQRHRTPFAAEYPEDSSLEERSAAYLEFFSYAGSYTVAPDAATITHHVAVARDPHWVGRDLVRSFHSTAIRSRCFLITRTEPRTSWYGNACKSEEYQDSSCVSTA